MEPPGRGGAAGGGARPPAPTHFGARVWAVTQKAPSWSQAPGGGVRPGARRAPGQVGRLPRGRAGSWGCRRCRRAPRARPAARCASLAEPVAGALGPPGDATAVAASVASTRDRCRGRLVSFGLFLLSVPPGSRVAGRARRDVCAPMAAAPGAREAGKGRCRLVFGGGVSFEPGGEWQGRRGPGKGSAERGGAALRLGGGGPWSCFSPERGRSWAGGWGWERRCSGLGRVLGCPLGL